MTVKGLLGHCVTWWLGALNGSWSIATQVHGAHLVGKLMRWRWGRGGHVMVRGMWGLPIGCRDSLGRNVHLRVSAILLSIGAVMAGGQRRRHARGRRHRGFHHTCWWWGRECLLLPPIMSIDGLGGALSKPSRVTAQARLSLGIRGRCNITLLTHFERFTVRIFSFPKKLIYNLNCC